MRPVWTQTFSSDVVFFLQIVYMSHLLDRTEYSELNIPSRPDSIEFIELTAIMVA